MIIETEIDEIVLKKGWRKLGIAKVPSWVDSKNQIGFEFVRGTFRIFKIVENEKVFNDTTGCEETLKMIDELQKKTFEAPQNIPETKKIDEPTKLPENKENIPIVNTNVPDAVLPDTFTPELWEKWRKMKTVERMMLFQNTPKSKVLERVGVGGKKLKYVTGNYMFHQANAAFLYNWDFQISGMNLGEKAVAVWGRLTVDIDGQSVSRESVGYEDINQHMNPQLAIKSATTDCIKKGLSLFGFNGDVYGGETT